VSDTAARNVDTGSPQLLCRIEDRVAVVTLNRPEARNALTWELKAALVETVPRLGADPGVGCLLLTGAGQAFCSGGDTKNMAKEGRPPSPEERKRILRWEHSLPEAIHRLEKPVVAALPGPAAGAGLSIALSCDLRIMAESAFVTTSYARLGLSGDYGGSWFMTKLIGTARARELYFTAERVDARECERIGLANRVVPDADLEKESLALCKRIAAGPPIALRYMKDNLNRALREDLQSLLDLECDRMVQSAQTEDYLEAVRAFQDKRAPAFKGR
jgi:enoyl-CoA hydratase/carnithine racemase